MIAGVQRWRDRVHRFRPTGETINPRDYEVAWILGDAIARAFVVQHHYAESYPAAVRRVGLYRHEQLVGVAVFSVPTNAKALTRVFPGDVRASLELGRFVLLDDVPANGETWFLGQAFALLRQVGLEGVVSFSDPVARTDAEGRVIFPGHIGTIYQAHNAQYLGLGTARTLRLLPTGAVVSPRSIQKVRAWERGAAGVVARLEAAGAPAFDATDRRAWLQIALATCTRPLRHTGNHRYAWPLHRRRTVAMAAAPYPKGLDRAAVHV